MGREANIHSIQALEKQIKEGKGDTINLKRIRNSLLNISTRVPPEIFGYVFVCSLVRKASSRSAFEGLRMGSYNFLLVCHHWFKVASRIPELWSFWGNNLQDWKKRYYCSSSTTPLDLVLDGDEYYPDGIFDESLQYAVKSRVIQDTIRQVHLSPNDSRILTSIILSLTPDNDESAQTTILNRSFGKIGHFVPWTSRISSLGPASRNCVCSTSLGAFGCRRGIT